MGFNSGFKGLMLSATKLNVLVSLNTIRVTRSSRTRWTGHVASMEGMRKNTKFWSGDTCWKDRFAEVDVDESIILKCMLKKCGLMRWEWIDVAQRTLAGCCENSNEPSVSLKGVELLG